MPAHEASRQRNYMASENIGFSTLLRPLICRGLAGLLQAFTVVCGQCLDEKDLHMGPPDLLFAPNPLISGHDAAVCLCRHARGCTGHLQADAARQASHDVLSNAVPGDPAHLQKIYDRRMSLLCKATELPAGRPLSMAHLSTVHPPCRRLLILTSRDGQHIFISPAQQH